MEKGTCESRITNRLLVLPALLLGLCGVSYADEPTDLPGIEVVAYPFGNFMIPLFLLYIFPAPPMASSFDEIPQGGDFTKEQACDLLASQKPDDCILTTYPPMPGYGNFPGWDSATGFPYAPNGCGTGALAESLTAAYISQFDILGFSGNLDTPIAGDDSVVFSGMCNAHDTCYAGGHGPFTNRGTCDNNFHDALRDTCGSYVKCKAFADIYYSAVDLGGGGPYAEGHAKAMCSRWGHSMEENGCDEQ